jgi:DNA (cytosine-5)-methyltransferase 1
VDGVNVLKIMKILNLYAGIGGNRKLWADAEVTAIEYNEEIASIYRDLFPMDTVIVTDAHDYLAKHYKDFDFIWSSPPCPSHSKVRMMAAKAGSYDAIMPNMSLWSEIIFLQHYAKCKWVVENVKPYYDPLIEPTVDLERHYFWSNFDIPHKKFDKVERNHNKITGKTGLYGFDIQKYKIKHRKDQIIRNCVNPELGEYILECSKK